MAKTKTTKKVTKKTEANVETFDVKATARKSALAYLGLFGFAFDRAQFRAEQVRKASGEFFDTLVEKGEKLEKQGLELTKDAREKATELVETTTETVKNVVPFGRETRVEELEAEVAALNKKIAALSKKASASRKTVKTEKVAKTAA